MTKPTRLQLLDALAFCQSLFGQISGAASDRNPNRAADIEQLTRQGLKLCIEMRSADPPGPPQERQKPQ